MTSRTIYGLLLPVGLLALLSPAQGQGYYTRADNRAYSRPAQDPGDIYMEAFRYQRESEMLAERQSYNSALQKAQEAERLLATLVRDYPDWKRSLVDYKRKMLAENMAKYRQKAGRGAQITRQPTTHSAELPRAYDPSDSDYRPIPLPNPHATNPEVYEALARAQEECRRMAEAYRELKTRFTETQRKLKEEQENHREYRQRYERLMAEVTDERIITNNVVNSQARQLEQAEQKYREAEVALQEAQTRSAELETRLLETEEMLARMTSERDSLLQENKELRAIVELNSPEKTKALLDQNLTLAEQLKEAQEKIQQLESMQSGASDENAILTRQLEETRAEADRLRDEMSGIYDENMGYRKRISELTAQLNNMEADLAAHANEPVVDPALAEENQLLRGLIEKQRRTIAMQEESRRLLFETYKALKKDDPEVMKILQKMQDDDPQELTAAERKILEDVRNGITQPDSDIVRRNLAVETLAELANNAFSKGRYASAEQLYLNLYDIMPDNVAGLVNLGTILLYNNKNEDALQYLTRATRLAPDTAVCYYLAGIAQYRLEQLQEARRMFSRTVQLDPGNAEAFFYLANIEALSGTYDRALKHFAAAVKIKPELADAHYNMARLYAETKRVPEAARSYDRAIHNGAAPDPEFEAYLRQHPDNTKAPGADLVATVKPEAEARALHQEENPTPKPADKTATAGQAGKPAEPQITPEEAERLFLEEVQKIAVPVQAVQQPSPAGAVHETDDSRFATVQMRTPTGIRMLRLKRAQPQRLRIRGSEELEQLPSASARK